MMRELTYAAMWTSLRRAWRFLIRMDIAAILVVVVLLTTALGSCFPQASPAIAADASRWARWETDIRARYGALTDLLAAVGVFRWFYSPVFLIPPIALAVVTLACTLDRWRRVWRRAFHQPVRPSDLAFDAAPHNASISVASPTSAAQIVHERLRQRGFHVRSEIADDAVYLRGDRNRLAPLATLLHHVAVLLLLLGAVSTGTYGWRAELTIAPDATVAIGRGSDLSLRNEGFTIARYPDGSAAAYEVQVAIVRGGRVIDHRSVRVNEPLNLGGIGIYLQSYKETVGDYAVTLLAVHDPGYGLVVVAGFMLLAGLVVTFNFPHCYVRAHIKSEGKLRLAGEADRYAHDFEREFAALAKEVESLCSQD